MANVRAAGALILLGFAVYVTVGLINLRIESDISPLTIGGSLLVFVGFVLLARALRFPSGVRVTVLAAAIGSAVLGRAIGGMEPATFGELRNVAYFSTVQSVLITVAAGLALSLRGNLGVRILSGVAVLGNVAALVLLLGVVNGYEAGTISDSAASLMLDAAVALDNLLLLAALVFVASPPRLPDGQAAPGSNPFGATSADGGPAQVLSSNPGASYATAPSAWAQMTQRPAPKPTPPAEPLRGGITAGGGSSRVMVSQARRLACPRCQTVVTVPAGARPSCASCGFGA